jgi:hypothetical protein
MTTKWFKHVHVTLYSVDSKEGSLVPVQTPRMSPHCLKKCYQLEHLQQ